MMEQCPCMTLGKTDQQSLRHFVAYVGIINFMYEIFHHVGFLLYKFHHDYKTRISSTL